MLGEKPRRAQRKSELLFTAEVAEGAEEIGTAFFTAGVAEGARGNRNCFFFLVFSASSASSAVNRLVFSASSASSAVNRLVFSVPSAVNPFTSRVANTHPAAP